MRHQQPALDVQQFLDNRPFSAYQWLVFALCFCVVLLDGFDTASIGYIAPLLMAEWGQSKAQLAPVLSAALVGLIFGSMVAGPLADRFGRRRPLVGAVFLFGIASLFAAKADSLTQLTIFRFITGIGLGAAMPNAITLMSEYCPGARRATLTNGMFCGFPLGAALGGFLAAWMMPHWGWRSVLLVGGVAPVLLGVVLLLSLPESVRFMVARAWPGARIRAVLSRIGPIGNSQDFRLAETCLTDRKLNALNVMFSRRYAFGTAMLWITYFMGLVIFYALVNWMPVLFRETGLSSRDATMVAALFPLGGVGAVALGWLMDRYNADRMVAIGFALSSVAIFTIGQAGGELSALVIIVMIAGTLMSTSQASLPSLAAQYYPTAARASGVAWMLAAGRIGAIAGAFLVGQLVVLKLDFSMILAVLAIPGLLAATALFAKQRFVARTG
ncbi:MFS transporter [Duganella radicis]|uniref:MFS transporter n=1 Tax=Duganella radicis TaxID=551988 RepID=A0A6L6PCN9_9BURK|nr:MFS transporter [Duganella radicis]MTV36866.1 MFS transporter [Duganella radicis]